ncbi:gamma-glutamylcyclotransferase family protein [Microbulbifer guangxiensis]|uniref:gamma-glutamylcyclotransferase family protein n=1 Tax=Microbulbifer guangxiensis TaxID=2904249 RepID=UPI001F1EDA2A|nr:gamma-glutamylcyclotransferase family protein [Microbulbifer guangxiensis]
MSDHFVAVYGSLKKGFYNHPILAGSDYIGTYKTENRYTMVDLTYFPGVVERGATCIHVEVYSAAKTTMTELDILEGHPTFFCRKLRWIEGFGNAWLYLLPEKQLVDANNLTKVIASGYWEAPL